MPPSYVKPYVKRNKHDAADAEAVCEAVRRPSMRFVPVKTPDQQAALVAHCVRDLEKCSRDNNRLNWDRDSTAARNLAAMFPARSRSRLLEKLEWSHTESSTPKPDKPPEQ